jgi:cell division protein FtsB
VEIREDHVKSWISHPPSIFLWLAPSRLCKGCNLAVNRKVLLKYSLIALPVLALLVGWLGFGERGFIHLYRMEGERKVFLEKISLLEKENQRLLEEIDRLRSDREYMETVARRELGMVKENEILYRFEKKGDRTARPGPVRKKIPKE